MKLIDTHNHLYLEEFDPEQEALVDAALKSGIDTLLLPNVDLTTIDRMHNLCDRFPGFAYPMMGLHPTSVDEHYAEALKKTESYLGKRPYCAIGEIGIDLYWDKTYLKEQKIVFEEQLKWSIDLDLPVAIHTRDAYPEVLESIHKVGADKLTGVFHSFTGTITDLEEIKKLKKFKLGINGVITFKNSKLSDTILSTDINSIVLETDAPYLAPVPYRGKRNEPIYIWKTAEKVADTYGLTLDETVEITRKNALDLFKITNKHA
ncbi:TatD family hydrolase [Parabacteroides gordonii]|uniref:TatD family hydrolase n=1 Tax=Parabacteroides gordonii MS-1 = DSM 23371 TaxID=1203610 RepID=A0A0F5JBV1_9BACT|nr:TatD family hydrolase [Parabacteroides gordonii]KKB55351.1 TatD family hydrolase [Parabacteroides gordonii MS-1 = DSM 23371]MCA5581854.1 TatD family hydrolase [Parabacteroides gordonii]RGP17916.1 TatD family deoxyribonuclease [Parabacteroides gordonii]